MTAPIINLGRFDDVPPVTDAEIDEWVREARRDGVMAHLVDDRHTYAGRIIRLVAQLVRERASREVGRA